MKPQMLVCLCLLVLVRSLPFTDETGKVSLTPGDKGSDVVAQEWTCDNAFYQRLAPEQWAEECAGLTKSSQGVTFPSSTLAGASAPSAEEKEVIEKLRARVARYLPKDIEVDTSYLNNTQVTVVWSSYDFPQYHPFPGKCFGDTDQRRQVYEQHL